MNKDVERQINQIYTLVYNKIFTKKRVNQLSNKNRLEIIEAITKLESSDAYTEFAKRFAKELSRKGLSHQRGIWRKFYKLARKLNYVALPKTFTEYEARVMAKAVRQNFTMIKSIPNEMMKLMEHKYVSTLIEEVAKGNLSRGSFAKELVSHGHKNAKLIARTETAKLQTAILESRSTELGSVAYIWRASNDQRTRPSHKAMNDVIVFWRQGMEKPLLDNMYGNAGEFPNCRCTPQPIVDTDDLDKTNYKVYDYQKHEVVTMGKKELIDKILAAAKNI